LKVAAIIQARMGSTRLPGKILMDLCGKSVLHHVIERVRQVTRIDDIIVATTEKENDTHVALEAHKCGAKVFRGSEDDVLSRFFYAGEENSADIIVRITSDCPLIDPFIIDNTIKYYCDYQYDLVTNSGIDTTNRTFPRGFDVSVFSFAVLKNAFQNAAVQHQREHVTPYIYENYSVGYFKSPVNYAGYRLTLDTEDDFALIQKIYSKLYNGKHDFYLSDIVRLFKEDPELIKINQHVEQKKVYKENA
jgi:spore coat polysaccharide biosynthesis protein SpsF